MRIMGLSKAFAKLGKISKKKPTISGIDTNTSGRILRMQDAKVAFSLNNPNYVVSRTNQLGKPSVNLVTIDEGIAQKIAKMHPLKPQSYETMSTAEKMAVLQKRADCRAAFSGDLSKVEPRHFWDSVKCVKSVSPNFKTLALKSPEINFKNIDWDALKLKKLV